MDEHLSHLSLRWCLSFVSRCFSVNGVFLDISPVFLTLLFDHLFILLSRKRYAQEI